MRSISQYCGERGSSVGPPANSQINGTQSLNRNMASRSTGAILVPTTNASSTLSSNSSAAQQQQQQFHTFNQNALSSSTHHLSYVSPNEQQTEQQHIYGGSARVAFAPVKASEPHSSSSQPQHRSATSLNNDLSFKQEKTLGLSDEDLDDHGEDETDDDEDDDKTNAYEIEEFQRCTCGKQHEHGDNDDDENEYEDGEEEDTRGEGEDDYGQEDELEADERTHDHCQIEATKVRIFLNIVGVQ